jgi:SAM-dependent methyltransferase
MNSTNSYRYLVNGVPLICTGCGDHPFLNYDRDQMKLFCPSCMKEYPEYDKKPCFIDNCMAGEWGLAHQKSLTRGGFLRLLDKVYGIIKAPRIKSQRRYNHFNLLTDLIKRGEDYKALYVGYNQPFDRSIRSHIIELEVVPKEHVDVIAFGESLPFPNGSFDLVVLSGVIEHTANPFKVVDEAYRVLKNDGTFYVSTPWVYPFHGGDNYRFSYQALQLLCAKFSHVDVGSLDGPFHAFAIFMHYLICQNLSFGNRYIRYGITIISSWLVFPLIFCDSIFNRRKKEEYVLDANLYAVARK